jgi:hypothetical protein
MFTEQTSERGEIASKKGLSGPHEPLWLHVLELGERSSGLLTTYPQPKPRHVPHNCDASGLHLAARAGLKKRSQAMTQASAKPMMTAIAADLEQCATSISTAACTRFPVHDYKRPE